MSSKSSNVRVARQFSARPQRVFDAWLDPLTAGKWLFATATGEIACVEIDARVGGWFYIVERYRNDIAEHIGEYLEIARPHRLVFTLSAEKYSLDFERVTVTLEPHPDGCELSVVHETRPEFATQLIRDWTDYLNGLAAVLRERVPVT
jgi:uncharacterized protein YndB with AHSA1/START domain